MNEARLLDFVRIHKMQTAINLTKIMYFNSRHHLSGHHFERN